METSDPAPSFPVRRIRMWKKSGRYKASDIADFDVLDKIPGIRRGPGGVICMYDQVVTLKGQDRVIPVAYL